MSSGGKILRNKKVGKLERGEVECISLMGKCHVRKLMHSEMTRISFSKLRLTVTENFSDLKNGKKKKRRIITKGRKR